MKKCRTCGHAVSPRAKVCPSCGEPIKKSHRLGCGGAILLILLVSSVAGVFDGPKSNPHPADLNVARQSVTAPADEQPADQGPDEIDGPEARAICAAAFERAAQYDSDYSYWDMNTWERADHWIVKFPAKAQNGFGAWKRVYVYCKISKEMPDPDNPYSLAALLEFKVH